MGYIVSWIRWDGETQEIWYFEQYIATFGYSLFIHEGVV